MRDISLHILDIMENAINARASRIVVRVVEDQRADRLTVEIKDNGPGMTEEIAKTAHDPFFTTKPGKRFGLGLSLLRQAAREGGGDLEIESDPKRGTVIRAVWRLSHPDRKPLGDIDGTVSLLKASHPEIDFGYETVKREGQEERYEAETRGSR
jgi:signal transduction histidine kinase